MDLTHGELYHQLLLVKRWLQEGLVKEYKQNIEEHLHEKFVVCWLSPTSKLMQIV